MKPARTFSLLVLLLFPMAGWANSVGVTELTFRDASRNRPVNVMLWYPAEASAGAQPMSYDLAFFGKAIPDAPYRSGKGRRPLLMLSHGDRGSPVDQSWLAESLAAQGYLVAAVSHWLNTWKHNIPEATLRVWDRPKDISFAIDGLLEHPVWGPRINGNRIAAAGHSMGGYTALALVGADYIPRQMQEYCESAGANSECSLADGADLSSIDFSQSASVRADRRIKAVIAMAPALGPGIRESSLAGISIPTLIVAAQDDEILRHALNAGSYAARIPNAELLLLPRGGHFVFLPECTLVGMAVTYVHRFDICGTRNGSISVRAKLHADVERAALSFLDLHLPAEKASAGH